MIALPWYLDRMQPESREPVRLLRARAAEERSTLQDLERSFTHESMKSWVGRALSQLDDAEVVFLRRLEKDSRTAFEEAQIILGAENQLQQAIQEREKLQDAMATRGVGAMLISMK